MRPFWSPLAAAAALAATLVLPASLNAAEKAPAAKPAVEKAADKPAGKKNVRHPFHGKVTAVDNQAKTFSIKGAEKDHLYKVTAQTRITKAGKPAVLGDAVVGEDAGGLVERQADGSELAISVRFGAKVEGADAAAPKKDKEEAAPRKVKKAAQ